MDNRHTGKPKYYCGSYPFKKESTSDRKKGKIGTMTIHVYIKKKKNNENVILKKN